MEKRVTISGAIFEINAPYAAGHVLTDIEAGVLNQTWCENIRNNTAAKVAELGPETSAAEEHVTEYASTYTFSQSGGGRGPAVDPVTEEAHRILKTVPVIKKTVAAMKGTGATARQREYLDKKLADNPDVRAQAEANVESARNMALKIKV